MVLSLVLGLAACASISVDESKSTATKKKPTLIYVLDFSTEQATWEVDRQGKDLADFKANLQLMLKTAMVADISDKLLPAQAGTKADLSLHKNVWVVRGQFVQVNQGSRLLRGAVGFGAGGTKLETRVQVYDQIEGAAPPFLTFSTSGGSNAEPGAVAAFSVEPVALALGGVSGVAHGLSEDTKRTARMITASLSDYLYKHGWIPKEDWIQPKQATQGDMW